VHTHPKTPRASRQRPPLLHLRVAHPRGVPFRRGDRARCELDRPPRGPRRDVVRRGRDASPFREPTRAFRSSQRERYPLFTGSARERDNRRDLVEREAAALAEHPQVAARRRRMHFSAIVTRCPLPGFAPSYPTKPSRGKVSGVRIRNPGTRSVTCPRPVSRSLPRSPYSPRDGPTP